MNRSPMTMTLAVTPDIMLNVCNFLLFRDFNCVPSFRFSQTP